MGINCLTRQLGVVETEKFISIINIESDSSEISGHGGAIRNFIPARVKYPAASCGVFEYNIHNYCLLKYT